MDTNSKYTLHVDGALIHRPAVGGVLYLGDAEVERWCLALDHGTSNIAEIEAIRIGVGHVPPGAEVEIITDSQYAAGSIDTEHSGWSPKANHAYLAAARAALEGYRWTLTWHPRCSSPGAVLADKLANAAATDLGQVEADELEEESLEWCPERPPETMEQIGALCGLSAISVGRILETNGLKYDRDYDYRDGWAFFLTIEEHGHSRSGKTIYTHRECHYRADRVWRVLAAHGYRPIDVTVTTKRLKAVSASVEPLPHDVLAVLIGDEPAAPSTA